jgi:hypothetical protein
MRRPAAVNVYRSASSLHVLVSAAENRTTATLPSALFVNPLGVRCMLGSDREATLPSARRLV